MRGFSLRELFCLTALAAALISSAAAESVVGVLLAVFLWATAGAIKHDHPIVGGALAASTAVVGLIFTFWAEYLATYFISGSPADYFEEDGFAFEVIVSPIVYVCVYGSLGLAFGAAIGAAIGLAVRVIRDHLISTAVPDRLSGDHRI